MRGIAHRPPELRHDADMAKSFFSGAQPPAFDRDRLPASPQPPRFGSNALPPSPQFAQPNGWPANGRQSGLEGMGSGGLDSFSQPVPANAAKPVETVGDRVAEVQSGAPQQPGSPQMGGMGLGAVAGIAGVATGATMLGLSGGESRDETASSASDTSGSPVAPDIWNEPLDQPAAFTFDESGQSSGGGFVDDLTPAGESNIVADVATDASGAIAEQGLGTGQDLDTDDGGAALGAVFEGTPVSPDLGLNALAGTGSEVVSDAPSPTNLPPNLISGFPPNLIASDNASMSSNSGSDDDAGVAGGSISGGDRAAMGGGPSSTPPTGAGGSGSGAGAGGSRRGGGFPLDLDEKIALGVAFVGLGGLVAWGVTGDRPLSGVIEMAETVSQEALVAPPEADPLVALTEPSLDREAESARSPLQAAQAEPIEPSESDESDGADVATRARVATAGAIAAARSREDVDAIIESSEIAPEPSSIEPPVLEPEEPVTDADDVDADDNEPESPVSSDVEAEELPEAEEEVVSALPDADVGAEEGDEVAAEPEVEDSVDVEDVEPEESADGPDAEAPDEVAALPPTEFADVNSEYWAFPFIDALREEGIVAGGGGSTFNPDKSVTRAELAAQIDKAFPEEGQPPAPISSEFPDIPAGFWGRKAIDGAISTGFMSGYSEGVFRPAQLVPRYQVLVSMVSGLELTPSDNPDPVLAQFTDGGDMPDWAKGQVAAAVEAGLVVNYPTIDQLQPEKPATRAEVAAMIHQALVQQGDTESVTSEYIVAP